MSRTEKTEHAGDVVPGDPNTQWYSMPSPSRLSYFLERFSDTNFSHIRLNLTRATPIGNFLASQIEEIHIEDMKKIMLSYCLPNQIQFNIVADATESNSQLAFYSLIAKMMFSTSPGCRNVTVGTTRRLDAYILG